MAIPNLRAIRDWCKETFLLKQEILNTKDLVESNEEPGKLADALVIKEVFQSVSKGKELLASAITDKGIETDAGDTFAEMADKIAQIESSGEAGGGDEVSFESVSFSISSANASTTVNLKNYTDKYADISIGNGIFIDARSVRLNGKSSVNNSGSYSQSYDVLKARSYSASTGVLTLTSGTTFNYGCTGYVYYIK